MTDWENFGEYKNYEITPGKKKDVNRREILGPIFPEPVTSNTPEIIRGLAALDTWGMENTTGPNNETDITISNKKLKKGELPNYQDLDTEVYF